MVFSGLTVFLWPSNFQKNGSSVANYPFPAFTIGTALLSVGMFWCAFLVERASKKHDLPVTDHEEIYWLQPGNQEVGDQVVEAFVAVSPGKFTYKKSVRDHQHLTQIEPLLGAVSMTMVGFILQFVGLRGLHSSVTLAQLGITLAMAVIRASLRAQRMDKTDNLLLADKPYVDTGLFNESELDWFTFHLHNLKSFHLTIGPQV
jgi:hypothetical protein